MRQRKVQICRLPAAPLPSLLFAASGEEPAGAGKWKWKQKEGRTQCASGRKMEKKELEDLRVRVQCAAALEKAGFAIDLKESTRRAVKFRGGGAIIIVIHEGRGWFDPLSDAKGDVFGLVEHLDRVPFVEALDHVASLVDFVPKEPVWTHAAREIDLPAGVSERWTKRRKPWPGSMTWRYLRDERCVPEATIRAALRHDLVREGPRGSMWAAHRDSEGAVSGWEERGPEWRGFSTGGAKVLFRFGAIHAPRLCVTEAAIDAMSLAALESNRRDTLYVSTGGGWAPATDAAIRLLAARKGMSVVAATDNNAQGDIYADRLEAIARDADCRFERHRPHHEDWNEDLCAQLRANSRRGAMS
ncbi:DUF3991 domain-containing protein (plasmid) [Agrobacterium fabrum]|nr:DUF3991 domain-containing protein [Rhizobium rhizogenes]UXS28149.1 DUF3991 domain-containing protein [Agrobacterium tumefaciens]UXT61134.1 DUF3991 domain-containing protein [Agrobacterium fabrum]UXS35723.1 DUF3991 domain-containing protein [Agrobacterium tumefaciens]UXT16497.1 DUF3991 domain-containing protein [Agrobacterium tumefaciens]